MSLRMTTGRLTGLMLILMLGAETLPALTPTELVQPITVEGEAIVQDGDLASARQRALQEACAAALTKTLGAYLSAESFTRNYQSIDRGVFSKTSGYIKTYEILEQTHDGDLLSLQVAVEVSSAPLVDDLTALGILLDAVGQPVVAIEAEPNDELASAAHWLRQQLATHGIRVVDDIEAANLRLRLEGHVLSRTDVGAVGLHGTVVGLTGRAVRQSDAQLLAQATAEANATAPTERAAVIEAYRKAAEALFPRLERELTAAWQRQASLGNLVSLYARVPTMTALTQLKRRIGRQFGVDRVQMARYSGGSAELLVRFRGSPAQLAELLEHPEPGASPLVIEAFDDSSLTLSLGQ